MDASKYSFEEYDPSHFFDRSIDLKFIDPLLRDQQHGPVGILRCVLCASPPTYKVWKGRCS
jgi:hypothetical protein